tara:strand:- start:519 stop:1022 length:504 start_codon:yes stop_codon:yes gene_type:complete
MKVITSSVWLSLILLFSVISEAQEVPEFTIRTIYDEVISSKNELGKRPTYIVFWATWCPSCLREIPNIKVINEKYGDDIMLVAVNIDRTHFWYKLTTSESKQPVREYLKKQGIDYKVALDDENILSSLSNVRGTPTQILIDKKGIVRQIFHLMPSDIISTIDQLVKE